MNEHGATRRSLAVLALTLCATALPSAASAQEPPAQKSRAQEPPPKIAMPPAGRSWVVVHTNDGTIEGKLVSTYKDSITVATRDRFVSVDRATILAVEARELPPDPEPKAAPAREAREPDPPPKKTGSAWDHVGLWGSIFAGPVWGSAVGPTGQTVQPAAAFGLDMAASLYCVYAGVGGFFTFFKGYSFSNDTTDGVRSSGAAASGGAFVEGGLTQGIFIPTNASGAASIELRPGVGYGYEVMSSVNQVIENCMGCDSRSYDYATGQYVRAQLGVYFSGHTADALRYRVFMARNGLILGLTTSVQHFVIRSAPGVHDALMFGLTVGWSP